MTELPELMTKCEACGGSGNNPRGRRCEFCYGSKMTPTAAGTQILNLLCCHLRYLKWELESVMEEIEDAN